MPPLPNYLVDISDQEKRQLGARLNEGPCQTLSGIWLYANALYEDLLRLGLPQAEDARQIGGLVKEAAIELKQLLKDFQMTPLPLEDEDGLILALEYLAEQTGLTGKSTCTLRLPRKISFPDTYVPTHLYRIAQMAVQNATWQSNATHLIISLRSTRAETVLTVQDNGNGVVHPQGSSSGMGLEMMQCRALAIGAILEIRRLPVRGTSVVCTLPAIPSPAGKSKVVTCKG